MSSPEFFEQLALSNPDGLWLMDADGRTLYANPAMAELLHLTPEEMSRLNVLDVLDESSHRDFLRHRVESAGGQENIDALLQRADGSQIWALVSWVPIPGPNGSPPTSYLHRVTEYTERRRLTERLRAREQQLSTAQAIAHLGSWEWTVATDELVWSDELYRIYRVDPESVDLNYRVFLGFFHPDDVAGVDEVVRGAFAGPDDTFEWEARINAADGSERWIRGRGRADQGADGAVVAMRGTAQDVTDLKRAASEAHSANEQLRAHLAFTEASNQALSVAQALQHAIDGNPADSGWMPVGLFERPSGGGPITRSPVDIPLHPLVESEAMAGRDVRLAEIAWHTCEVQVEPIPWQGGTGALIAAPIVVEGSVTSVVEALIENSQGPLASPSVVRQITRQLDNVALREHAGRQLEKARDEAMAASALKSDFLATMSHEIRTPMNGVIGLNDLILDTDLDRRQRHLAEALRESGMTLLGIINDILDLSKIESGKLELVHEGFDVRQVIDHAAGMQAGAASESGIELIVACEAAVPSRVVGDSVRFGQILSNLCSNAVKFTDHGEVDIRVRVARREGDDVVLRTTVRDTGIGIPAAEREALFDPFVQGDPSTTRRHGGTGLGLTICRRLATALGGEIGIEDVKEPPGTLFWFTTRFRVPHTDDDVWIPHPGLEHRRALLVEDNQTAALVVAQSLREWGISVDVAGDASAADEAVSTAARQDSSYDVVLVDQTLPGGDATKLTQDLGTLGHPGGTVILGTPQASWSTTQAGADVAQVSKPVRVEALHSALVSECGLDGGAYVAEVPAATARDWARVLVVEDNPVNQLVATGFLEALGCRVDVADNGAEALPRLLGGHDYSLILMDCRMPRMDGYEATRAIRLDEKAWLEPGQAGVPIVAMTASVLAGERQRCLDAGMNDFLTKPVDSAELARAVSRWVPTVPAQSMERPPSEPVTAEPVLDLERVAELASLVKDGVSFFERTRTSFELRIAERLQELLEAIDTGDSEAAVASAHSLKGSAANLGLSKLGGLAAEIEAAAESDALPPTERPRLERELQAAVTEALEALRGADAATD